MCECNCEYYKDYCNVLICSKKLHDEKNRKHEKRYDKSKGFFFEE